MDQMTPLERALLAQFETLEAACGSALEASEGVSEKLAALGQSVQKRLDQLEERQTMLAAALDEQTRLTELWKVQSEALVTQVNTLLTALRK